MAVVKSFQRKMAVVKSFQRFFNKHTPAINHDIFTRLYQWLFGNLKYDSYTLDVDSSIFTRYGNE